MGEDEGDSGERCFPGNVVCVCCKCSVCNLLCRCVFGGCLDGCAVVS